MGTVKIDRRKMNVALFTEGLDKLLEVDREIQRTETNRFYHANRRWPEVKPMQEQRDSLRTNLIAMYDDMCSKHY